MRLLLLTIYSLFFLNELNAKEAKITYSGLINNVSDNKSKYPFILIDCLKNVVLLENNAHKKTYPSSMTKVMTLYILFSALKDGTLNITDMVDISVNASKKGGSKMFLKAGDKVSIGDLIIGIAVCSGNDAAITIAEAISGSEEAFVSEMNYNAKTLFMDNTNFKNASGLPDNNHYSTVYDLALLSLNLMKNFPEHYHVFSKKSFNYNNILQYNYNKLVNHGIGVDGIKTGHTDIGGHGIIVSAKNNFGRRLLLVINECEKESIRNKEVKKLLRFGFQNFDNYVIATKDETVTKIIVWAGEVTQIDAVAKENIILCLERRSIKDLDIAINYKEPISAPIKKGDVIANLTITNKLNGEQLSYPLIASRDINSISWLNKVIKIINYLIFGN